MPSWYRKASSIKVAFTANEMSENEFPEKPGKDRLIVSSCRSSVLTLNTKLTLVSELASREENSKEHESMGSSAMQLPNVLEKP